MFLPQDRGDIKKTVATFKLDQISKFLRKCDVGYGSRTRVAAVKEKRPIVI